MELLKLYYGTGTVLFTGLLLAVVALPLIFRKIRRNNFYGFRLTYTLKDDDIWYEVNAMLGKHLFIQGIVLLILGGVSLVVVNSQLVQLVASIIFIVILIGGIIYSLILGTKKMNAMAREKGLKDK